MITCHQADSQFIENPQVAICNHVWKRCEKNTKIATGNQDTHTRTKELIWYPCFFFGGITIQNLANTIATKREKRDFFQISRIVYLLSFQSVFCIEFFFGVQCPPKKIASNFVFGMGKPPNRKYSCSISQRLSLHYNLYLFT